MSTLYQVVRTRSSSSLHWPLCLANLVNGALWAAYGLVSTLAGGGVQVVKAGESADEQKQGFVMQGRRAVLKQIVHWL